jgi:RNA polymerase primary sigma factor
MGSPVKSNGRSTEDLIALYLKEIARIPLLSREEEQALARRAAGGDPRAKDALIRANLRFVVLVAKRYRRCGLPFEDLINEGNIGLIQAVERYDADRGCPFISYAVWWIRHAVLKAIRANARLVHRPAGPADEPDPAAEAYPAAGGGTAAWLEPLSLDSPVFDEESSAPLSDLIADRRSRDPDELVVDELLKEEVGRLLSTLPPRDAVILEDRFGLKGGKPVSLQELGNRYLLTKERIRQIEKRALRRLRHRAATRRLKAYLN